jgi:hypothetical protein
MSTRAPFPGGISRPGRDPDNTPTSNAEVKNEEKLYLLSPWLLRSKAIHIYFYNTLIMAGLYLLIAVRLITALNGYL